MQHPFRDSANCVDALDRNKEKSLLYNQAAITHKMVRYAQNFLSWHIIKDEAHDFIIPKNNVDIMLKYLSMICIAEIRNLCHIPCLSIGFLCA